MSRQFKVGVSTPRMVPSRRSVDKRLFVEQLECRRLLAGDTDVGDDGPLNVVRGRKWEDLNGNGVREANEQGLARVTIYADVNNNGFRDSDEPATRTFPDTPDSEFDESGTYWLADLPLGRYFIREVVPSGFVQTFPGGHFDPIGPPAADPMSDEFATVHPEFLDVHLEPGEVAEEVVSITVHPVCIRAFELDVMAVSDDPSAGFEITNLSGVQLNGCGGDTTEFKIAITGNGLPHRFQLGFFDAPSDAPIATIPVTINASPYQGGGHFVVIEPGTVLKDRDFGNQPIVSHAGSIHGTKWLDSDGNGRRDTGEAGLGGVSIYLDLNRNGTLDRDEPWTETMFDDPVTDFDESGQYWFDGIRAGEYVVREVVPRGYQQTFPGLSGTVASSETGRFAEGVAIDLDVTGVGLQLVEDGTTDAAIDLTVVWPNSCGTLLSEQTTQAVVGDHILVNMYGRQVGDQCAEVISPQTQTISVSGLGDGRHTVVATLHEEPSSSPPATASVATLGVVAGIVVGDRSHHVVAVEANQSVDGIDFGNRQIGPGGSIGGLKWLDTNGDGRRQWSESGLAGITVYLDINQDGRLDEDEPSTQTREDDLATPANETGLYIFRDLSPGQYMVREIVPDGFAQTYPPEIVVDPLPGQTGPAPGRWHFVTLRPGEDVRELDFGNQPATPGSIHGIKWRDANSNGRRERAEPGLAGVTVYVDVNSNGQFDPDEPHAETMEDNPETAANETGMYWIEGVRPGSYWVGEVVPDGFRQTFPAGLGQLPVPFPFPMDIRPDAIPFPTAFHFVEILPDEIVDGINFGNAEAKPGSIHGTKWLDANGNGRREANEAGLAGVTIYVDLNFNGQLDQNEPRTVTMTDDPNTRLDEAGMYWLQDVQPGWLHVREVVPDGFVQTFPRHLYTNLPWLDVRDELRSFPHGLHFVFVRPGQTAEGIDFGNRPQDDRVPDSDRHADDLGPQATKIELETGPASISSFIDSEADRDVFQFVGSGSEVMARSEVVGTQSMPLRLELLDSRGNALASVAAGNEIDVFTNLGETYYLRVTGGSPGQYMLELQNSIPDPGQGRLPGDADGDGEVSFADFVTLANNFGKTADVAYADGDFDFDGEVSFADFVLLANNFGQRSAVRR